MAARQTAGHVLALALATLWAIASQAHFTGALTPDMHASLKKSTHDMHQAFKPWGFSEEQIRYGFGTLGALSTYFLLRRSTRGLGLVLSIAVTLVGRVYPQMTIKSLSGQDLAGPMAVMILAAFSLGLLS